MRSRTDLCGADSFEYFARIVVGCTFGAPTREALRALYAAYPASASFSMCATTGRHGPYSRAKRSS